MSATEEMINPLVPARFLSYLGSAIKFQVAQ